MLSNDPANQLKFQNFLRREKEGVGGRGPLPFDSDLKCVIFKQNMLFSGCSTGLWQSLHNGC